MVVQINSTILNRFQEATLEELQEHWHRRDAAGDRGNGRVLMLDDGFGTQATVSQQAGRTGYLYDNPLDHGRITVHSLGSGIYGPSGLHRRLALVNPPVHDGETVIVVYAGDYGDMSLNGQEVTVTAHSGAQLQVRNSAGHRAYIAQWALPADAPRRAYDDTTRGATSPASPEKDLTISDWWINRIVSIAQREGRRRRWCSELNEILRDIFRPLAELAPKWTIEQSEDREGWWVVKNQEGVVQATVADRSLVEETVLKRNRQLEAQYVPQITDR